MYSERIAWLNRALVALDGFADRHPGVLPGVVCLWLGTASLLASLSYVDHVRQVNQSPSSEQQLASVTPGGQPSPESTGLATENNSGPTLQPKPVAGVGSDVQDKKTASRPAPPQSAPVASGPAQKNPAVSPGLGEPDPAASNHEKGSTTLTNPPRQKPSVRPNLPDSKSGAPPRPSTKTNTVLVRPVPEPTPPPARRVLKGDALIVLVATDQLGNHENHLGRELLACASLEHAVDNKVLVIDAEGARFWVDPNRKLPAVKAPFPAGNYRNMFQYVSQRLRSLGPLGTAPERVESWERCLIYLIWVSDKNPDDASDRTDLVFDEELKNRCEVYWIGSDGRPSSVVNACFGSNVNPMPQAENLAANISSSIFLLRPSK